MRELSKRELVELGRDLNLAKIGVLVKWGFTVEEISKVMGMSEVVVRHIIDLKTE